MLPDPLTLLEPAIFYVAEEHLHVNWMGNEATRSLKEEEEEV